MITMKDIVGDWLTEHGYGGLYMRSKYGTPCYCGIDDLMACSEECLDCEPAYCYECPVCGNNVFYPELGMVCEFCEEKADDWIIDIADIIVEGK